MTSKKYAPRMQTVKIPKSGIIVPFKRGKYLDRSKILSSSCQVVTNVLAPKDMLGLTQRNFVFSQCVLGINGDQVG